MFPLSYNTSMALLMSWVHNVRENMILCEDAVAFPQSQ